MNDTMTALSDEDLMSLYQSGEAEAFAILYQRHAGRLLAFLQSKAAPELAREVLQESFFKLHRARHQYSPQLPFLPWLFTIARNALVDALRGKAHQISGASKPLEEFPLVAPEESRAESSREVDFSAVLRSLPEAQRRAIELRYLKDWSFEEIASDLATSPGNVRQMVSRGLRRLRRILGGK
jgi:RNA polymerase sigma factor (sigma-70 family)